MADFYIEVGVDYTPSYNQVLSDVTQILNEVNKNLPKIKLEFDTDGLQISAIENLTEAMTKARDSSSSLGTQSAKTASAMSAVTKQTIASAAANTDDAVSINADLTARKALNTILAKVISAQKNWTAAQSSSTESSNDAYASFANTEKALTDLLSHYDNTGDIDEFTAGIKEQNLAFETSRSVILQNNDAVSASAKQMATSSTAATDDATAINADITARKTLSTILTKITAAQKNWTAAQSSSIASSNSAYASFANQKNELNELSYMYNSGLISASEFSSALSTQNVLYEQSKSAILGNGDAVRAAASEESVALSVKKQYNTLLTKATSSIKNWSAAQNSANSSSVTAYNNLVKQKQVLTEANTQYKNGDITLEQYTSILKSTDKQLQETKATLVENGDATSAWSTKISGLIQKFSSWLTASQLVMLAVNSIKSMITNVIELDSALTQLEIVTGATDAQLESFLTNAIDLSKELGQSITDVIESIETFSRLGYDLEDSTELAEYANILANVANVDTETATTGLTSILKGYSLDVEDAEHIADVLVEVGQSYAISAEELMTAFENGGAALAASGTSFEQSAALFAATNAALQDASSVGTMWKTVSARIRGATTELEELGEETDGLADGLSKYRDEIISLTGVDIMIDDDTYKDMYDIFTELATVWDDMASEEAQARVSEILGGTRQLSGVMSTITNISDAVGAYESALDSAGTATEANDVYMESAQAHIDQMKVAFQELSITLVDSGLIIAVVDAAKAILEFSTELASIGNILGGVTPVIWLAIAAMIYFNSNLIATKISTFSLSASLKSLSALFTNVALDAATSGIAIQGFIAAIGAAVAVITIVVMAVNAWKTSVENSRQASITAAESAATLSAEISDLAEEYLYLSEAVNNNTASAEDLLTATDNIIEALGLEQTEVEALTAEYGSLDEAIKAATASKLADERVDLTSGLNAASKNLTNAATTWTGSSSFDNVQVATGISNELKQAMELIPEISLDSSSSQFGVGSYVYSLDIDTSTTDGAVDATEKLQDALVELASAGLSDSDIYASLDALYQEVSGYVTEYLDLADSVNDNILTEVLMTSSMGENALEMPTTEDEFDIYRDALVELLLGSNEFVGDVDDATDAVDNSLSGMDLFSDFYSVEYDDGYTVDEESIVTGLQSIADTAMETAETVQSAYDVLSSAKLEMNTFDGETGETGGLSTDTISEMAELTEDYLDYLYEENGVIKLNTQAWEEYMTAKAQDDFSSAVENLVEEKEALAENIETLEQQRLEYLNYGDTVAASAIEDSINEQTEALTETQEEIERLAAYYDTLYGEMIGGVSEYADALENLSNVSSYIDSMSTSLATVADLQVAVANGFAMSVDEAMAFAEVYPEILNNATATADGQITLNEEVVTSFITAKQSEATASIDAQILELEAEKATATAKLAYAQAQLELAVSLAEGESDVSTQTAENKIAIGNAATAAMIEMGVDEATAYQLAAEAMAGNSEEFQRIASEAAANSALNFDTAAVMMAESMYNNMNAAQISLSDVAKQAQETAKAIAGVSSGTVAGSTSIVNSGGGASSYYSNDFDSIVSGFNEVEFSYDATELSLDDFIIDVELDISDFEAQISQLDGQIAVLEAYKNSVGDLSNFATDSSSSSSSDDDGDNWFEIAYAKYNNLLNLELLSQEEYLAWLNDAYKQAYDEQIITLNDFYQYQEEVFDGLRELFDDYLGDTEHEISMRSNYDTETKKIISLYEEMVEAVEEEIAFAYAYGLSETDEYIQELQSKWQDYVSSMEDIYEEITDTAKDAMDTLIDYQLDMIEQSINDEIDALDERLNALSDFYDEQKELLQDAADEEDYLEEQAEKRDTVADLESAIEQLKYDDSAWAQSRVLELEEELAEAQKELDDFEEDYALELAIDAIDEAYNAQEALITAEMDALEDKLNDPELLFNQALSAIQTSTEGLYEEMLEYNRNYGTGNDEDVTDIYEEAYAALEAYKDLYGEYYNGVVLTNSTGYTSSDSWDDESISSSGTTSSSSTSSSSSSSSSSTGSTTSSTTSSSPSLSTGSSITVKSTATNFSSKSGSVAMASFVPGGSYTVYGTSGSEVLIGKNGVYTGWINKTDIVGYASGTSAATPGLHTVDEEGAEYVFSSSDGSNYRVFSGGEKVLNANATDFLYKFANSGGNILDEIISGAFGSSLFEKITPSVSSNEITMGDIIVTGNADSKTVSEIRREQRASVKTMLEEFAKLQK